MDQDLEMSADASVQRHLLDEIALASALVKIVRHRDNHEPVAFCAFATGSSLLARLRIILEPSATLLQKNQLLYLLAGLAAGSLILLSCMM
jgi:hypothetical protein